MGVESAESQDGLEDHTSHQGMMTAYQTAYHDADDAHPPPTPPGAAEALFLGSMRTNQISAAALAAQIHLRHRPLSIGGGTSIATDDFLSATDVLHSSLLVEHDDEPFGNDALIHTREALIIEDRDFNMASAKTTKTTKPKTTDKPMHVDPAEKIYDTAKGESLLVMGRNVHDTDCHSTFIQQMVYDRCLGLGKRNHFVQALYGDC